MSRRKARVPKQHRASEIRRIGTRSSNQLNSSQNNYKNSITSDNLDSVPDHVVKSSDIFGHQIFVPESVSHDSVTEHGDPVLNVSNEEQQKAETVDTDLYCDASCSYGRKYDREMIQCSSCMFWFHSACSDVLQNNTSIWNCTKCRCIPETVNDLKQQLVEVHSLLSELIAKQNEFYSTVCESSAENNKLKLEIKRLKEENYQLRLKQYNRLSETVDSSDEETHQTSSDSDSFSDDEVYISSTKEEYSCKPMRKLEKPKQNSNKKEKTFKQSSVKTSEKPKKPKVTVFGSSIVRGVGPKISSNLVKHDTVVYSTSGLTIQNATNQATYIFKDHAVNDMAVLQVGTCDVQYLKLDELTNHYDKLIEKVSRTSPNCKIIITSVPHRVSPGSASLNIKVDMLNQYLRSKCSKNKKLHFIEANPPAQQSYYRDDGTHFNYYGTQFFAKYLSNYISNSGNFYTPETIFIP